MTINISTPDGSNFAFPDGTAEDVIKGALDQHFGQSRPQAPSMAVGLGRSFSNLPIIGPLATKADAATNAALAPYADRFLPDSFEKLPEATFGERYQHALDIQNRKDAAFQQEHPVASIGANVAGNVAAAVPLGSTSLGARLLGLTGGLGRQMLGGAASGGIIGGADTALRGGNLADIATGAGAGVGLGAAGPLAGKGINYLARGARNLVMPRPTIPENVTDIAGVKVPLSSGQATGDLAAQQMEQNALRNGEGGPVQRIADRFFNQEQAPKAEEARSAIGKSFDPSGNVITNPTEAGELAQQGLQRAAAGSKANYNNLYESAFSREGAFHASTFEGLGQKIKAGLSLRNNPTIIDDVTTPIANRALNDIDQNISMLRIPNKADPFGPPNPEDVVGVNLQGVWQQRKRLVSFAQSAAPGSADRRAMGQIIGEFDNRITTAMKDGLFSGDPRAIDEVRAATAAYKQHKQLFSSQPGDFGVGAAMERIIGKNGQEGATPEQVANYLMGNAKVGSTNLSVKLAQHIQQILGDDEWNGIRQGVWARLTTKPEGMIQAEAQAQSQRIMDFLNGSGASLAKAMFSQSDRDMMRQYAGLMQQLRPKPGAVNYSNTAPVLRQMADRLGGHIFHTIAASVGASAGGLPGAVAGIAASAGARAAMQRAAAGRVARSLYGSASRNAADRAFANQMARYGSIAARSVSPALDSAVVQGQ
jgi:hypothetical protein